MGKFAVTNGYCYENDKGAGGRKGSVVSRVDGYGIKHGTVDSTEMIKIF